jgi:hypothetical protein
MRHIVKRRERDFELFGIVRQNRVKRPESSAIYEAVLRARARGARVYRAGVRQHRVVWGWRRTLTDAQLLALFPA